VAAIARAQEVVVARLGEVVLDERVDGVPNPLRRIFAIGCSELLPRLADAVAIFLEAAHDRARHAREVVRGVARVVRDALTESRPGRIDVPPVRLVEVPSFRRDPRKTVVELGDKGLALDLLVLAPALEDSRRLVEIAE